MEFLFAYIGHPKNVRDFKIRISPYISLSETGKFFKTKTYIYLHFSI